jgi:zinc protease
VRDEVDIDEPHHPRLALERVQLALQRGGGGGIVRLGRERGPRGLEPLEPLEGDGPEPCDDVVVQRISCSSAAAAAQGRRGLVLGMRWGSRRGNVGAMKRLGLVLVALAACSGGSKQPTPRPPDPIVEAKPVDTTQGPPTAPAEPALPMWSDVKKGVLPNGLTYYIHKNKKPDKRVLLWLAVNSGSVQEDDDQRGLAHFVEHMAFNGTKRFPKDDIIKYIEGIGMRFGADLNAYTSWDETVYQLEVPTDDAKIGPIVSKGFDVLRDWSADVVFDPKEVDKERGVVLEEWRLGLGAGRRLFDKHVKVLFKGSRYADRITIGLADTLKTAPRDTLYRYYKDFYRPDLMAVVVVGDIADSAAIEKEIQAKFGDLKAPPKERTRPVGEVPKSQGTRISIETDHEQTSQSISVLNLVPSRKQVTEGDFRRQLGEQLYGRIINERMRLISRKKDAAFQGASAGFGSQTREIDAFSLNATIKNGQVEEALRALFTEVLRVEQHGFTQGELDRARTAVARGLEQGVLDAPTAQSRPKAQELVRNFFESEFVIGPVAERDLGLKLLPTLSLATLNSLARGAGGPENRVILYSGPDDKAAPTQDKLRAVIDDVAKQKLEPWIDKAPPSTLMAALPKPGTITKETKSSLLGTTEWTLSNGARVIVRPSDFDADTVLLSGTSPGGLATISDAAYPTAKFADTIAGIGGVAELDVDTLSKLLTGKQVNANTSINEVTESVSGRASVRDLETMFQLLHLRITAPRKDDDAIAVWRANLTENLVNREKSPDYQFSVQSGDVLYQNHIRRKATRPADVAKIDVDKALAFYKDRFSDVGDFTFVIVGAVDLAKLKPLVETYLASLPSKGRKEKEKDPGIRRVGGVVKKSWALGQEPKARVSIMFHGDEAWTRDKDRDMYVLSRVLSIRLREVMREDLGGVYGVGAGGGLSRSPRQERTFSISFGADPTRVDELIKAAQAEVDKVLKNGVDDSYLDKVRKGYERDRELQLRTNSFWLGWLESSARFGDDPNLVLDPKPMLDRMTVANVKASIKKYLDGKRVYQAVMMPAASAKK